MEIVARLPLKSLGRLRCVCRYSSLTNPKFATNHVIRAQENSNAQKVVCFVVFESFLYKANLDTLFDKGTEFSIDHCAKVIALPMENSWRPLPHTIIVQAVQVGGFLHWQVDSLDSVLTFDLAQEKFGKLINIPKDPNEDARIFGEYGVAESWTKLISLKALRPDRTHYNVFPMCYIKEGRVLLLQNVDKIILYDLDKESFSEQFEIPIPQEEEYESWFPVGGFEGMTSYGESLVSPNYI
ncbi:F-box protein [Corchorus olitorius]|uniref:F-box protein n=1 Tax=Corchorus olitorius TaxID=93759 RepID=A0A1R3JS04_9ROSI|nr:F-box protein [Corchorus olitorius]